jgi:L-serine dehydratase
MVSLFDILGPVMVGPSSSHTAGACRLGLIARAILGGTPEHAVIRLHGSFAATGEGHGTHRALVGGLAGLPADDMRLREAFAEATAAGVTWEFENIDLGEDAHPNTAVIELTRGGEKVVITGASIGGGRVEVTQIDDFPVLLTGAYHTLVVTAQDQPGTVAAITGVLSKHGINVATMRVDRTGRRKDALMTIELDDAITDAAIAEIRAFPWLQTARRIHRIS